MGGFGRVDPDELDPWTEEDGLDEILEEVGLVKRRVVGLDAITGRGKQSRKRRSRRKRSPDDGAEKVEKAEKVDYGSLGIDQKNQLEINNKRKAAARRRALHNPVDPVHSERIFAMRLRQIERIQAVVNGEPPPPQLPPPILTWHVTLVLTDGDGKMMVCNPYGMTVMNRHRASSRVPYNRLYTHRLFANESPEDVVRGMLSEVGIRRSGQSGSKRAGNGRGQELNRNQVLTAKVESVAHIGIRNAGMAASVYFGTVEILDELKWGWQLLSADELDLAPEMADALERARLAATQLETPIVLESVGSEDSVDVGEIGGMEGSDE